MKDPEQILELIAYHVVSDGTGRVRARNVTGADCLLPLKRRDTVNHGMIRKPQGFAVLLIALFTVATCGVLFAHPGPAAAEPCGGSHVWALAKPASERVAPMFIGGAAVLSGFMPVLGPDTPTRIGVEGQCEPRFARLFAEPPAPRAPPLA